MHQFLTELVQLEITGIWDPYAASDITSGIRSQFNQLRLTICVILSSIHFPQSSKYNKTFYESKENYNGLINKLQFLFT